MPPFVVPKSLSPKQMFGEEIDRTCRDLLRQEFLIAVTPARVVRHLENGTRAQRTTAAKVVFLIWLDEAARAALGANGFNDLSEEMKNIIRYGDVEIYNHSQEYWTFTVRPLWGALCRLSTIEWEKRYYLRRCQT